MASHRTLRIDEALVDEASREAGLFSRSAAGQIEHWARLGRAVERAPGFSHEKVGKALAGELKAEDLNDLETDAFFAQIGDVLATPTEAQRAYYEELGDTPGAVGRDPDGVLRRRTEDGRLEEVEEARRDRHA